MNAKRFLAGTVVGLVALLVLDRVTFDWLFSTFHMEQVNSTAGLERSESIWWALVVGMLFYSIVINVCLDFVKGGVTIARGAVIAGVIGVMGPKAA